MQPGDTISPNDKPEQLKPDEVINLPEPVATETAPQTSSVEVPEQENIPQASFPAEPDQPALPPETFTADQPESTWQYQQEGPTPASLTQQPAIETISWTASEYIEHEKRASWFVGLSLATAAAGALMYLITRDFVSIVVAIIVAALFGATGVRKPRTLNYQLDASGVSIGEKHYPYDTFKSFSVLDEGAFSSVMLLPLKRFMPPISLYYPPDEENSILQTLSSYLPHEERNHDPIDRLMHRIRF